MHDTVRVAWLKEENHDEYWDDPLHWNRTSVKINGENKRKVEKKISEKEGLPEDEVVVMQTH